MPRPIRVGGSVRFSLVEVPKPVVDDVIVALRGTTLKGKKPKIERERPGR